MRRALLAAGAAALLASCAQQVSLQELQTFTLKDVENAQFWALFNDDKPAVQCLDTLHVVVLYLQAQDPKTYGVLTLGQFAADLANPNGKLRRDCAALAAERKAQVQQAIGQIMSLAASPGLAL